MTKEYIENRLAMMRKAWPTASPERREVMLRSVHILKTKLRKLELEESYS